MSNNSRVVDDSSSRNKTLDRQIAAALTLILLLYTLITLGTFSQIPPSDEKRAFFEQDKNLQEATLHRRQQARQVPEGAKQGDGALEGLRHTFPVHVGDDVEVIDHPGLAFANQNVMGTSQQLPPKLTVPRFWDSPLYGEGGVRQYLGNFGDRLMTPEEASNVGSFYNGMETIYVSIASYRDPECVPTLEDLYKRAKHPERIRTAIIDQRAPDDKKCSEPEVPCSVDAEQALCKYRHLMDFYDMDARLAAGPVFARHLGHRHFRGEYFAMQVDSHVRFVQDWEDDLIWQWKSAKNEYAVLTTYLSDLIGSIDPVTHHSKHPGRPIMCKSDYEGQGGLKHLRHGQQPEGMAGITGQPTLEPFWAAGFSFARAHFVTQIPYDQYLPMVFQGEEISIGLRAFTYGYDFYAMERSVCFHMYAVRENKEKRKKVKLFWENSGLYKGAGLKAMQRLNGIIGMDHMDNANYYNVDEKKYGLGKVRTTAKFFKTFGIHTDQQKVENHLCQFVGRPMMTEFMPHLRKNGMGINYDEIDFVFKDPNPPKPKPGATAVKK